MSDQRNNETDAQHVLLWRDRLQDAIDGALSAMELAAVSVHLRDCDRCRTEQVRLQNIDAHLRARVTVHATPSAEFDARLFTRIAAMEEDARIAARLRERRDHQARLAGLQRSWRDYWRFNLGNILGGIAAVAAIVGAMATSDGWLMRSIGWFGAIGQATLHWPSVAVAALVLTGLTAITIGLINAADRRG